eukprot:m.121642 g.121642  ORF g.121642 m.121642 type:complete len:314 (+) comp52099_c0_seq2:192-1133(+)
MDRKPAGKQFAQRRDAQPPRKPLKSEEELTARQKKRISWWKAKNDETAAQEAAGAAQEKPEPEEPRTERQKRRREWWQENAEAEASSAATEPAVAAPAAVPAAAVPVAPKKPSQPKPKPKKVTKEQDAKERMSSSGFKSKRAKTEPAPEPEPEPANEAVANAAIDPEAPTNEAIIEPEADGTRKKYLVFVGNIPFTATAEDVRLHFARCAKVKGVRLLTEKGAKQHRGFAFVEFEDRLNHGRALALHLTKLHGRMINVELTVGGGGTSENRQAKIEKKNKARRSLAQVKGEAERTKVRRQQEADFRRKTWRAR